MIRGAAMVLLPVLLGAGALALREATRPAAEPGAAGRTAAVALPLPIPWRGPADGSALPLDPVGSTACFELQGSFCRLRAHCPVQGLLRWGSGGRPEELQLRFDLAAAALLPATTTVADLWHVLGVRTGSEVVYRGRLTEITHTAVPGVAKVVFVGPLAFGTEVRRQTMELWLTTLAPRNLRLLGVGGVADRDIALPRRYFLGLYPESSRIRLALDLAVDTAPAR